MSFNPMSLEGKRILITGASSGIGRATAQVISNLGATTVLLGRSEERLKATLSSLSGEGHGSYAFDLCNTDGIPALLRIIASEQGRLSGLFHSAGVESNRSVKMISSEDIDRVFCSSIKAAVLLTRGICQKDVRAADGLSIVFMSSVAGQTGTTGRSVYSASKAAVDGAMRSLACELAPKGVRVNSVAAGAVQTEMMEKVIESLPPRSLEDFKRRHLLGFGSPHDVANAVAFLLSGASKWITGTVCLVDGGYCCQ
ncbi:MAG: SDR family oxidoreductase [Eubacteriales bacterium]|nr:SDR family oxidoreductase [Eubacteriales bacterium]